MTSGEHESTAATSRREVLPRREDFVGPPTLVRTTRQRIFDLLVVACALLVAASAPIATFLDRVTGTTFGDTDAVFSATHTTALGMQALLIVVLCAALYWRRARPMLVLSICWVGAMILLLAASASTAFVVSIAVYSVASRLWRPPTLAFVLWIIVVFTAGFHDALPANLLLGTPAWLAGAGRGQTRSRSRAAILSLDSASAHREAESLDHERLRFSQDLHDVLSHTVGLLTIEAMAAQATVDDSIRTTEALDRIERAANDATTDLRALATTLVGVENEPQPTVTGIEAHLTRDTYVGLDITCRGLDQASTLPDSVDVALFRIAQEALGNAAKHGGPSAVGQPIGVQLALEVDDNSAVLTIENEIDAQRSNSVVSEIGGGFGLRTMSERAAAFGGRVDAGVPTSETFTVRAELPLSPHGPLAATGSRVDHPPDQAKGINDRETETGSDDRDDRPSAATPTIGERLLAAWRDRNDEMTTRQWLFDAALAATLISGNLLALVANEVIGFESLTTSNTLSSGLLAIAAAALLALRRYTSLPTFAGVVAIAAGGLVFGVASSALAMLIALYTVVVRFRRPLGWWFLAVALSVGTLSAIVAQRDLPAIALETTAIRPTFTVGSAIAAALVVGLLADRVGALRHQKRTSMSMLHSESARRERRAIEAERQRLSRDLVAVLTTSVADLRIQAAEAKASVDLDHEATSDALQRIESTSRTAMSDLRTMLTTLRTGGNELDPQPALGALPRMLEEGSATAGNAEMTIHGDADDVPESIGVALVRIIQEALGNAAGDIDTADLDTIHLDTVRIDIVIEDSHVDLVVDDHRDTPPTEGMLQRARAFGGTIERSGATPRQAETLRARLPLTSTEINVDTTPPPSPTDPKGTPSSKPQSRARIATLAGALVLVIFGVTVAIIQGLSMLPTIDVVDLDGPDPSAAADVSSCEPGPNGEMAVVVEITNLGTSPRRFLPLVSLVEHDSVDGTDSDAGVWSISVESEAASGIVQLDPGESAVASLSLPNPEGFERPQCQLGGLFAIDS